MKIARTCYYRSPPQLQCRNYISAKLAENRANYSVYVPISDIKPQSIYSIITCANDAFPPIPYILYSLDFVRKRRRKRNGSIPSICDSVTSHNIIG
jgi:hypothetical protein